MGKVGFRVPEVVETGSEISTAITVGNRCECHGFSEITMSAEHRSMFEPLHRLW